ncbi:hypothetical protein [Vibrio phage JSF12]|uniref:Uncharacterized protein n=2 Tax=Jesfedecavirus TaxID=2560156 RepID=A0A2D0Z2U3_9CAUD|nr:hypothetical protein FDI98_gp145 [Vibrio phage JSF10]YP_009794726.1 hypothetical protein HOS35_gp043 [Vibrio phage JSF12]ASV43387.1 hypothetical protein [Vibrio phage JSF10]ASV43561.1 hypothetical protein [Vibrio phage JSF12]
MTLEEVTHNAFLLLQKARKGIKRAEVASRNAAKKYAEASANLRSLAETKK